MKNEIIKLEYTQDMVERAYRRAEKLGILNGSMSSGAGNFRGYLGEEAVASYLGIRVSSCDEGDEKYHYDMVWNNQKIDVKTKARTVMPKLDYDGSIEGFNPDQKCDSYIFTCISYKNKNYQNGYENPRDEHKDISAIWLCGIISKDEYFSKSTFYNEGDIDPTNGHQFRKNRYNVLYRDMHPIKLSHKCELCGSMGARNIKFIMACESCNVIYTIERSLEVYR
jgi:hypothetical protein|tara:strand:+ start:519 stop:1190 length:672 start_codon:yes stop_codon:yes gene_type:complete